MYIFIFFIQSYIVQCKLCLSQNLYIKCSSSDVTLNKLNVAFFERWLLKSLINKFQYTTIWYYLFFLFLFFIHQR